MYRVRSNLIAGSEPVEVISLLSSDTEDEVPQARPYLWDSTRWSLSPPSTFRNLPPRINSGWIPPVKGFSPPFTPGVRAPIVVPISKTPPTSSAALDAGGRPYPSPYGTHIPGRTILDHDVAKAKARTALVPTELRAEAERYHSVLEYDLSITSDRLAYANQKLADTNRKLMEANEMLAEANRQKDSTDYTLEVQARLLLRNRETITRLEKEADERIRAHTVRMKEIKEFYLGNLEDGTEIHMEMFKVPG